jgi:hypothetical protein
LLYHLLLVYITANDNYNPVATTEVVIVQEEVSPPPSVIRGSNQLSGGAIAAIVVVVCVVVLATGGGVGFLIYKKMELVKMNNNVPMKVVGVPIIEDVIVQQRLGGGNFGEVYLEQY